MARLCCNENFPLAAVSELRQSGHDVATIQEAGDAGRGVKDDEVLSRAIAEGRAVVTLNRRHFVRLHKRNPDHQGIIVCTVDPDFVGQAHRIHAAIEEAGDLRSQLIRVIRPAR